MPFSTYLADNVLLWFKGTTFPTSVTNVYISIHTGNPGSLGTAADVSTDMAGGRVAVSAADFNNPSLSALDGGGRQISNTQIVSITASALTAGTLTHFGLWDSSSAGNFLGYGTLSSSRSVEIGDQLQFPIGQLIIRSI